MSYSSLIVDYLGEGLASARPVSPNVSATVAAFYYATDTATLSVWNGTAWVDVGTPPTQPYTLGVFVPGVMANGQVLLLHQVPTGITFPANFGATVIGGSSVGSSLIAATASTVLDLAQCLAANDPTNPANFTSIGTETFTASGHAATLATAGGTAKAFAAGDWLKLSITTADATLANFTTTLVADRI
jgi:hypothetical protein